MMIIYFLGFFTMILSLLLLISIVYHIVNSEKRIQKNLKAFEDGETLRFVDLKNNNYIDGISKANLFTIIETDSGVKCFGKHGSLYPIDKCSVVLDTKK